MMSYTPKFNVMSISEIDHTFIRLVLEDVAVKMSLAAIKDEASSPIIRAKTLAEIMYRIHKVALDGLTPEGLAAAHIEEGDEVMRPTKLIAMDSDLFKTITEEIRYVKKINQKKKPPANMDKFTPMWLAVHHTDNLLSRMEKAQEFLFDEADIEEIMKKARMGII